MTSIGRYLNCGKIDTAASKVLQEAVRNKLITQTEQAIVEYSALSGDSQPLAALQALLDLPADRQERVVLHPSFRFWLQVIRRASTGDTLGLRRDFAKRLPDFVWSEQLVMGSLLRPWSVSTDDAGGLRCPSFGRYIELGHTYSNQTLEISAASENAIVKCADGLTIQIPSEDLTGSVSDFPSVEEHGYCLAISPRVADDRIEVTTRDPWLRVRLTGTNQRMDGTEFMGVDNELYPAAPALGEISNSLALLKCHWPEAYEDLSEFTRVIVPIDPSANALRPWQRSAGRKDDDNSVHLAFTVSSRQGAIYIGPAPVDSSVEMLIHENAHVKMRQIQALDPLLCDPFDETFRVPVPWRPDPRPLPGILEGLFVFAHVAEFEWRRWKAEPAAVSVEHLRSRLEGLSYAVNCLEKHAKLTAGGSEFLAIMKSWVLDLRCRVSVQ
jgi:HEXXH motif-containing protein